MDLGSVGRGHGSDLDLDEVTRWRMQQAFPLAADRSDDDMLQKFEHGLLDALKRDDLAKRVRISDPQAALCILIVYERLFRNLKQRPMTKPEVPAQLSHLGDIYLNSIEHETFLSRRR